MIKAALNRNQWKRSGMLWNEKRIVVYSMGGGGVQRTWHDPGGKWWFCDNEERKNSQKTQGKVMLILFENWNNKTYLPRSTILPSFITSIWSAPMMVDNLNEYRFPDKKLSSSMTVTDAHVQWCTVHLSEINYLDSFIMKIMECWKYGCVKER